MPQRQRRDRDADVRIRCDVPTIGTFIRECYDWWRDGCLNCVACRCVDSYEKGESSHQSFLWRMQLLYDVAGGRHGDGVTLPRHQLEMFANLRF